MGGGWRRTPVTRAFISAREIIDYYTKSAAAAAAEAHHTASKPASARDQTGYTMISPPPIYPLFTALQQPPNSHRVDSRVSPPYIYIYIFVCYVPLFPDLVSHVLIIIPLLPTYNPYHSTKLGRRRCRRRRRRALCSHTYNKHPPPHPLAI